MAANRNHRDDDAPRGDNPQVGHEERDVNVWAVSKFAIGLVLLCGIALALLFGLFRYFERREGGPAEGPNPGGITADVRQLPPEPRLQSTPVLDLKQIRDAEDHILGTYDWVDRQQGVVRIPIERAMEILAARGLPSAPAAPDAGSSNVSVPSESGLGPKMIAPGGPLASDSRETPASAPGNK